MRFVGVYAKCAKKKDEAVAALAAAEAAVEQRRQELWAAKAAAKKARKAVDAAYDVLGTLGSRAEQGEFSSAEPIVVVSTRQAPAAPTLDSVGRVLYGLGGFVPAEAVAGRFAEQDQEAVLSLLSHGCRSQVFMRRGGMYRHRYAK